MSKKKFTNGLESLFSLDEQEEEVSTTVLEAPREAQAESGKIKAKKAGKNFSSDMDDVIMKSFVTNHQEREEEAMHISYSHVKTPQRKPLNGLEALLRRTIDSNELDNDTKRRIVLILESHKLDKLKEIAKEEQLFLKDIINKSVNFYIDSYERKHSLS